jgi:hypothetical protein
MISNSEMRRSAFMRVRYELARGHIGSVAFATDDDAPSVSRKLSYVRAAERVA